MEVCRTNFIWDLGTRVTQNQEIKNVFKNNCRTYEEAFARDRS